MPPGPLATHPGAALAAHEALGGGPAAPARAMRCRAQASPSGPAPPVGPPPGLLDVLGLVCVHARPGIEDRCALARVCRHARAEADTASATTTIGGVQNGDPHMGHWLSFAARQKSLRRLSLGWTASDQPYEDTRSFLAAARRLAAVRPGLEEVAVRVDATLAGKKGRKLGRTLACFTSLQVGGWIAGSRWAVPGA
jgi:hypothetical protein